MRPIWKGSISFGLVYIPVTLYSAEQRSDLSLHMIDSRDFSRIRYERINAVTGEEVPWDQIVKGFEYDKGSYVIVNEEDLKRASPEATQSVEIESFVDLSDIDLMFFDKPYYLEPTKKGRKGYALLRETLRETGKAGIARVVIRTRQYIAAMVPRDDVLVLNLLRFAQELRSAADLDLPGSPDEEGVTKGEVKMARTLVESMTSDWNPEEFTDEYREALRAWIDQRIEAGEIEHPPEAADRDEEEAPAPINMMEALKRSLEKTGPQPAKKTSKRKKGSKKAG
jgi:DNA end-binding protein Ku